MESPDQFSFPMGLSEVPHCLLTGSWGPFKSMPYFLITNLFSENPYNFARNETTDSNLVFLESSNHSPFLMELLKVLHQRNGGRWGCQSQYHIFTFLTYLWENPYNFPRYSAIDTNRLFLECPDHSLFPMVLPVVPYCLLGGP